jgi:alpha-1,6-mannosyltransferase
VLPESPTLEARRGRRRTRSHAHALEVLPRPPVRVVDVALSHGERSGPIRTYLDAKAAWAKATGLIEHHVIVPALVERHDDGRHELPSPRLPATTGYRLPIGAPALLATLRDLRPEVVLLHDPLWRPRRVMQLRRVVRARRPRR